MVEQPERQNVSMTEQVEAKVAEFSKPMKDLVNQPQENTLSQRRISLRPEVPTAPRQPPRITGVLRQASLSRKPSVAHHSSPSPRSSKSPPPKNMCPEPSKIIMGPPVLRRTADDVYDICEKIGQCRLVRNKRKVHRPFKVDRWKVSPVSE